MKGTTRITAKKRLASGAIGILVISGIFASINARKMLSELRPAKPLKLYWFIPDGLRAEPELFKIYEWADQGLLPNLKKMMENGAYGYSIPAFPGHTPTNFANLLTGSGPKVHGVADGPMHIEGYPLKMVSKGGFNSAAKRVPPISVTLEQKNFSVGVFAVPGSTPPELDHGVTLKGRWGGWGVDFPAVIFQSELGFSNLANHENRVFYSGPELTRLTAVLAPQNWEGDLPQTFSPPQEVNLGNWTLPLYGYIYDSIDDGQEIYDRTAFSKDKRQVWVNLPVGGWSSWLDADLAYEMQNDYNIHTPKKKGWERKLSEIKIASKIKIKVIRLGEKGFFRLRLLYAQLNEFTLQPAHWFKKITAQLGPMVDFPDSYPAQLIHFPEDKQTFLQEAEMSLDWHRQVPHFAVKKMGLDVVIHSTYAPNQMLTSRWWLGHVDPESRRFNEKTAKERDDLLQEVKALYQKVDDILGEILETADPDSVVVFSSDHGAVPFDREVRLNNLFAKHGWLKFTFNRRSKVYEIDWPNTKVVYLQMDGVYIDPKNLSGNYSRAGGPAYEKLRDQVIQVLNELRDKDGSEPLARWLRWEDAGKLDLPFDRVADLIIANRPGHSWVETLSADGEIFRDALPSGYKQAVLSDENRGMWTPFVIMGPGVKKNFFLSKPTHHIHQYPTIMKLLKQTPPDFVEGKALDDLML